LKRLLTIVLVAAILLAAIVYSQYRPPSNQVSGFLEADEIRVGSRVGGRVAQVHVQEGERVTVGAVLVELEPFDLLEKQRQAAATLAGRQAELTRLKNGFRPEEIAQAKAHYEQLLAVHAKLQEGPREQEVEVGRARLRVAQAELTLAQQNHDRVRSLVEKRAASAEELDRAGERLEAANAMVALREQELDLLLVGTRDEDLQQAAAQLEEARQAWELTRHGFRQEEIDAAQAACDAAQYALHAIDRQIEELKIRSTVEGVVEALELEPGDLVAPFTPVLSLLDDAHVWVRAYVPQNRLSVHVGQKLPVAVDSFPKDDFQGTVTFVSRQAEFTPSNVQTPEERAKLVFRVKVTLDNARRRLRPGMSATIWLPDTESIDD
jgi:multidrug resistance efflux pump